MGQHQHQILSAFLLLAGFLLFVATLSDRIQSVDKQSDPVHQSRRRLKTIDQSYSPTEWRTVAFGSSRTWGAAIQDPEHNSFPGLMGAKNLAIRASGPEYPALCTYSMIGDKEIYDLIIIEYMPDWVSGALHVLARRLRHRFPDARILFLAYWAPRQYTYKPQNQPLEVFFQKRRKGPQDSLDKYLDQTNPEDWDFHPYDLEVIREAARLVNGYVLYLPQMDDPIVTLKKYASLYVNDMTHFSIEGHEWIRDHIVEMNHRIGALMPSNRVEPWDSTDLCTSWFETGKPDLETNMQITEFKPGKFAIETKSSTRDNIIKLNNPWEQTANIYLSYMATGPEQIYNNVIVRVKQGNKETAVRRVTPVMPNTPGNHQFHVVQHTLIGSVPPGESNLSIAPASEGKPEQFRTVGVILSPYVFGHRVSAGI
jgi:hypothetical protein